MKPELFKTFCTSKVAQSQISDKLLQMLGEAELTPERQFAILTAIRNGVDGALEQAKITAFNHACENIPFANEGKNFRVDDDIFRLSIKLDYNYNENDVDEHAHANKEREIKACNDRLKVLRKELTALEERIRYEHPSMKATVNSTSIAYIGTSQEILKE